QLPELGEMPSGLCPFPQGSFLQAGESAVEMGGIVPYAELLPGRSNLGSPHFNDNFFLLHALDHFLDQSRRFPLAHMADIHSVDGNPGRYRIPAGTQEKGSEENGS